MLLDERPLAFDVPGWLWELKFDGYRLMAEFGRGKCELKTRGGARATLWFPEIVRALSNVRAFPGGPYVVDGEACVLDDIGRSDFDRLHARAKRRCWYAGADPVTYAVFDLLVDGGKDITGLPLVERKERLLALLDPVPASILPVGHFADGSAQLFREAVVPLALEGLVAKRADSLYAAGVRTADWVKVKRKGAIPPQRFSRSVRSEPTGASVPGETRTSSP